MSNVIPFNQAPLPAFMQQFAGAADVNNAASAGIGGGESYNHISLKGGRFHVIRKGYQPQTLELFALNVIIVHANPGVTKAYYDTKWNPNQEAEAPACASDDGITPRADSQRPQCNACAACPQNQFGSKINPETGAESKACADKKTIAIVTPGQEGGEMLRLQIPTNSLKDFGAYLRGLPNVPYYAVVTEITFDTTASYPKIKFRPVAYISEQAAPIIMQRHNSDEAKAFAGVAGATAVRQLTAPQQPALAALPAYLQPQNQIPVQQIPQQAPVQQPVYQQPVQQEPVQQPVYQQPAQQPVYQQPEPQPVFAQPQVAPAPQPADPSVAAIFGGQQVYGAAVPNTSGVTGQVVQQERFDAPVQAAPQGNVHPSGREYGKPSPGKQRRTKAEMAEDAAVGIGKAAGETAEDEAQAQQPAPVQQAPVEQPVYQQTAEPVQQPAFGQAAPQQQPVYQQPANQPQVMQGAAVDAFSGWDD